MPITAEQNLASRYHLMSQENPTFLLLQLVRSAETRGMYAIEVRTPTDGIAWPPGSEQLAMCCGPLTPALYGSLTDDFASIAPDWAEHLWPHIVTYSQTATDEEWYGALQWASTQTWLTMRQYPANPLLGY